MSSVDRLVTLQTMVREGVMPLFYHSDGAVLKHLVEACMRGGAHVLEFTNRADGALDVFKALRAYCSANYPECILGVGTIEDAPTAALFIAYGADFIVSPRWNHEVAQLCNRRRIPYLPGCSTLTEIGQAEEWGVEIVKLFPADSLGGSRYIRSIRGPAPKTKILASGGIELTEESIKEWFAAGATVLALGSQLFSASRIAEGKFDEMADQIKQVISWINELKGSEQRGI